MDVKAESILSFDMDGTLVDTDLANFLSYQKAVMLITQQDLSLNYKKNLRFTRATLKEVFPTFNENIYKKILLEKEKFYRNMLCKTKLNQDLLSIIRKYSHTNRIILVTKCCKKRVFDTLNYHGLVDIFHDILTDCPEDKYQYAFSKLGINPERVIAFENEEKEIFELQHLGVDLVNHIK